MQSVQTRRSFSASTKLFCSWALASAFKVSVRARFSSPVSHVASFTRSVRTNRTDMPMKTVGRPSSRNSHCQPSMPMLPSK
ncbi:hypothetical protein D3C71_1556790 [compost metagenome]